MTITATTMIILVIIDNDDDDDNNNNNNNDGNTKMMIMVKLTIIMNIIIVFVVHAGGGGPRDRRLAAGCHHLHPCLFNSVLCDFDTQSHLSMQVEVTMIIKMITVEIIVMNVIVLPAGGGGP